MASAILQNWIDQLIEDRADHVYEKWIEEDLEEIEQYQKQIRSRERRLVKEINQTTEKLETQMKIFEESTREEVPNRLREINRLFSNLESAQQNLKRELEIGHRQLYQTCNETGENLQEYIPEVSPEEIYQKFLTEPTKKVRLPVIGEMDISPEEVEKRYDLLNLIHRRLDAFDFSRYLKRTETLIGECQHFAAEIVSRLESFDKIQSEYQTELAPFTVKMIKHLEMLQMRKQPEITQFVENIEDVLGLPVSIQIDAPDVSQDILFAELLQACDHPGGKDYLIQLGMQLGYQPEDLNPYPPKVICGKLLQHFEY
jgi:uncharacterized protein YaaN involved in tellurite resistance